MTDALFALVPVWGVWVIAGATYLSCLALPIPSSFVMLAGGAFAASGDLGLWPVVLAALIGAVLGDQTGYALGRYGLTRVSRGDAPVLRQAASLLDHAGPRAVFLTRWLFSPLGPYVNFLAGTGAVGWRGFTAGSIAGETVWVGLYVALGWVFAGQIAWIAELAGNIAGLLAALAVMSVLARRVLGRHD